MHNKMYHTPNKVKVEQLRRWGLAGYVAYMGGLRNYMFCRSEKLSGRENSSLTCSLLMRRG
jgi:hypothetical protein